MVIIANYGVGNLESVARMLRKAGALVKLSSEPADIFAADKLILPGVGNFGYCAERLRASPIFDSIQSYALEAKKPLLGICVGAQLLGYGSEEAPGIAGLGWIAMRCRRFSDRTGYRVPNMGWNTITQCATSPLFKHVGEDTRFYFVHSYYMDCDDSELTIATTKYSIEYTCAVRKDNIYGLQFHPEKSLRHGMGVLKAFAEL